MTIEAKTTTIPEKRITEIRSTIAGVNRWATIEEGKQRIDIHPPLTPNLYVDQIDGLIEMLHAIKASTTDAAGSTRRLVEAFDAADIIAVDEPTA